MFEVLLAAHNDMRFDDFVNCWARIFDVEQAELELYAK